MNEHQRRAYVANLYPSKDWQRKVRNMKDSQITAIYLRHLNRQSKGPNSLKNTIKAEQLTFLVD